MDIELLNMINQGKIIEIIKKYGFELDTFVRFWDINTIQIDGDLTLDELKILVEIMEAIKG